MLTVKDALKSEVTYPLPDSFYEMILIKRGLNGDDAFTQEVGVSGAFRLAYADCLVRHITAVNVSEAELSFSLRNEIDRLLVIANRIYGQHGEDEVVFDPDPVPTATYIGECWLDE